MTTSTMTPRSTIRAALLGGIALALFGLISGCASLQAPEESLRERAQAFWDARKAGDDITAYRYEEISLNPEMTLQKYLTSRGGIRYEDIEIKGINLKDPNHAEVIVHTRYRLPEHGIKSPLAGEMRDPWIRIDGQWFHVKEPGALFKFMHKQKKQTDTSR